MYKCIKIYYYYYMELLSVMLILGGLCSIFILPSLYIICKTTEEKKNIYYKIDK